MSRKSDDEGLAILGLIIVAIAAVVWFIVYVVLPTLLLIGGIAVGVGVLFALYTAGDVFCHAVSANRNPYAYYSDPHPHAPGVKRGYFFGPGLKQLAMIWSASSTGMGSALQEIGRIAERHLNRYSWADFFLHDLWVYLFWIASCLFLYLFGYAFTLIFCAILSVILAAGWVLFFAIYSLIWLSDKIALLLNAIENRCPNCKRRPIPLFLCPKCGTPHILQPGPYGVFHTKCLCGEVLPTTAFNGRNNLAAICPVCRHPLKGYAEHFGIQVVGSTSAGKTTYLSSFFHEYLRQLPSYIKYSCAPQKNFDDLGGAYNSGNPIPGTTDRNAGMYSITHEFPMHAPYQLSMYDIAGEAFQNTGTTGYQQQQFQYSEGAVLMIDPDNSPDASHTAIMSFCSEHKKMKNLTTSQMIDIPSAVVITKSDKYGAELSGGLQDEEGCRNFLASHGFANVINLITANFTNAKYFAATATGHELDGRAYNPSGVVEPVMWILNERKSVLPRVVASGITAFDKVKFALRKVVPFIVPVLILWLLFWGISSVSWGKILQTTQKPSDYVTSARTVAVQPASAKDSTPQSPVVSLKTAPPPSQAKNTNPTQSTTAVNKQMTRTVANVNTTQQKPENREVEKDVPEAVLKLSTFGTKVNVRRRPDINSDSLAMLDEGVPVEANDHTQRSDGVWYKVRIPGGQEGWIRGELLKPRIGDKGEHGGVLMRVTGDELNLRDGPGKRHTSIGKLYIGHLVEVVGRSGAWRKVYTQTGELGWVHGGYIGERKRYSTF